MEHLCVGTGDSLATCKELISSGDSRDMTLSLPLSLSLSPSLDSEVGRERADTEGRFDRGQARTPAGHNQHNPHRWQARTPAVRSASCEPISSPHLPSFYGSMTLSLSSTKAYAASL